MIAVGRRRFKPRDLWEEETFPLKAIVIVKTILDRDRSIRSVRCLILCGGEILWGRVDRAPGSVNCCEVAYAEEIM